MLPSSIAAPNSRIARKAPVSNTSMSFAHSSSLISVTGVVATDPWEVTSVSTSPSSSSTVSRRRSSESASRTLQVTSTVSAPRSRSSVAASLTDSAERLVATTSAPPRANARAISSPIPLVPPMTTAVCPSTLIPSVADMGERRDARG